jgi:hypothetical protein
MVNARSSSLSLVRGIKMSVLLAEWLEDLPGTDRCLIRSQ